MIGNIPAMLYSTVFITLSPNLIGHKHKTHHSKTKQGVPTEVQVARDKQNIGITTFVTIILLCTTLKHLVHTRS